MKKQIFVSMVLAVLISGCTSTRMINQSSRTIYFNEINKAGKGRKAKIVLAKGEEINGFDIHIASDSTSWTDSTRVITHTFPTSEINEIIFIKSGGGALQGLGLGALIGASSAYVVGAALVYLDGGDATPSEVGSFLAIRIGVPLGAIIGAMVGADTGSKQKFVINKPPNLTRKKK